jgi:dTDP-4-dehydrorhamnose reductase
MIDYQVPHEPVEWASVKNGGHVIEKAKTIRPELGWKVADIAPVLTSAFPTPAVRPLNSRLCTQKLQQAFDLVLPPWQQGVDRMLAEIL